MISPYFRHQSGTRAEVRMLPQHYQDRDALVKDLKRQVLQLKRRLARYEALEHDEARHDSKLLISKDCEKISLSNHTFNEVSTEEASHQFQRRLNLTFQRVFDEDIHEDLAWPFSYPMSEEVVIDWNKLPVYDKEPIYDEEPFYDEDLEEPIGVVGCNYKEVQMLTFSDYFLYDATSSQKSLFYSLRITHQRIMQHKSCVGKIIRHFKIRGRIFSNQGRMMREATLHMSLIFIVDGVGIRFKKVSEMAL